MIVVSNTSPLCYLVLLGSADALPKLYREVLVTQTVLAELRHPDAPESIRGWARNPPAWLRVHPDPLDPDASLSSLHAGERTTILLAERLRADLVLLDDSAARGFATQRQLRISGLLGVLRDLCLRAMLAVPGKIIETSNSALACQTQFAQSVPDARRLFLNWGADVTHGDTMTLLHRVVFYGDYMKPLQDLGDLMGFKVIEEGGAAWSG